MSGAPLSARRRRIAEESSNPLRRIASGRRERVILYVILTVLGLLFAFPLYSAVVRSLQINGIGNYISLFTDPVGNVTIWQTYFNSFAIGIMHATVVVIVSTTAGYAFSKLQFRGREAGFAGVLLFLAIPGVAILVPVYYITQQLGLFNTYIGVALPEAALTIPFGVLLMRNYGRNIPDSLTEAASIDGAGHLRVFWSIFLPLARPAIANLTILCFIWSLQDFLWPSFIFTDPDLASAAQAVQTFANVLGQGAADVAKYNASLVLLAVPGAVIAIFGLRFIINGLTAGSTKE
jgi:raffinose/stachyose/melibiose transport system permease protein